MWKLTDGSSLGFQEALQLSGLQRMHAAFDSTVQRTQPALFEQLKAYRANALSALETSSLLIALAPLLEAFLAQALDIIEPVEALRNSWLARETLFRFKKEFVQKRVKRASLRVENSAQLQESAKTIFSSDAPSENDLLATFVRAEAADDTSTLQAIEDWCEWALVSEEGAIYRDHWPSLRLPERKNPQALIPLTLVGPQLLQSAHRPHPRTNFTLSDTRATAETIHSEAHYCVYCHDHAGDFCSKGFPEKKNQPESGFRNDALGNHLEGCPIEEKISEMNLLKAQGYVIAPLAIAMIDNPMVPATGHRICNDCMKSCIYQKQDPVNIPQIETRVLTDVLHLPYGVEIYQLLTLWNPLKQSEYLPAPPTNRMALVVGLGPAGFTMAHYLSHRGITVVAIDGAKIIPLPETLIHHPIQHYSDFEEDLDTRHIYGFGGVAEYGITVRWDKNFLKLIYLTLARRANIHCFGGIRFGGAITVENAFQEYHFDHICLAVGAGLPKALALPGSLSIGMRQAADALMSLHLNEAFSRQFQYLQVQLPAVVIGGGLTAVDMATELLVQYQVQILEVYQRYCQLLEKNQWTNFYARFSQEDQHIFDTFIAHAKLLMQAQTKEEKLQLLKQWGGVTILYRKKLTDSPAYRANHEELHSALREGVMYLEEATPLEIHSNIHHQVLGLSYEDKHNAQHQLACKSIFVATGAKPNVAYSFEHGETFLRKSQQYVSHRLTENGELEPASPEGIKAPIAPFTSYQNNEHFVSFVGDVHPQFHGNVVKAIASSKKTYPAILDALALSKPSPHTIDSRVADIRYALQARVIAIETHPSHIVTLTIHAPAAVRRFRAGQFFRIQPIGTQFSGCEPIFVLGMEPDLLAGTIRVMIYPRGAGSKAYANLTVNTPLIFMGPTGVRTKIPEHPEDILLIVSDFGYAYLRAVLPELWAKGHRVSVFWVVEAKEPKPEADNLLKYTKMLTLCSRATLATGLSAFFEKNPAIKRSSVIADPEIVTMVKQIRSHTPAFAASKCFASVSGPMQCGLKGVCAQCLQWQIDPETGLRTKAVFACSWQDQPIDIIDLTHLEQRQKMNNLLEKLVDASQ